MGREAREGRRGGEAGELLHHGAEVGGVCGEHRGGRPARRPRSLPRRLALGGPGQRQVVLLPGGEDAWEVEGRGRGLVEEGWMVVEEGRG
ncbi:hypothetical protein E2562_022882 [Oryza meyeriana var. granulata]|uniref:Uncharacterized protein n=1 Tax=Oryza meyeriana var. granulata TaxID=110450 RepID=A0A6G1D6T6_9ORYZ|nr:hypothetical protein E2562_022882 [Oryza meyeriana var. granulata]